MRTEKGARERKRQILICHTGMMTRINTLGNRSTGMSTLIRNRKKKIFFNPKRVFKGVGWGKGRQRTAVVCYDIFSTI